MISDFPSDLEFRKSVKTLFESFERKYQEADPDEIEVTFSQGSLTFLLKQKFKIILSPQPPVHQVWLAAAHKGIAVHFSWNEQKQKWLDDKGKNLEVEKFLEDLLGIPKK